MRLEGLPTSASDTNETIDMPDTQQQFHFFASSIMGWGVGEKLDEAIDNCRKNSKHPNLKKAAPLLVVALVPVPKGATYQINGYVPQVPGTILIHDNVIPVRQRTDAELYDALNLVCDTAADAMEPPSQFEQGTSDYDSAAAQKNALDRVVQFAQERLSWAVKPNSN